MQISNGVNRLLFFVKRPSIILVVGESRALAKEAILKVLNPVREKFSNGVIFESDLLEPRKVKKFNFLLKKSRLPILVVTRGGNTEIEKLAGILPVYGFLILNFDDETIKEIKNKTKANCLTYGFQQRADLKVTDINTSPEGTNFKIDYQGNIVPFWLKNIFEKEQIYSVLAAICVGMAKEINLVEISQALRN